MPLRQFVFNLFVYQKVISAEKTEATTRNLKKTLETGKKWRVKERHPFVTKEKRQESNTIFRLAVNKLTLKNRVQFRSNSVSLSRPLEVQRQFEGSQQRFGDLEATFMSGVMIKHVTENQLCDDNKTKDNKFTGM